MKNVRSQFIEEVLSKQANLDKMMQEATNSTLDTLLAEKVSDSIRSFLNEEDEKEVDEKPIDKDDKELLSDDEDKDTKENDNDSEGGLDNDVEEKLGDDEEGEDLDGDSEDIWDGIEDLKNEDGAYDLRGMDIGELSKFVGTMSPEDGVTVEFDNGNMTIEDSDNDRVIEIDLENVGEDADDFNDGLGDEDDETEFEIDLDGDDELDDEAEFEIDLDGDDFESDGDDFEGDGDDEIDLDLDGDDEDIISGDDDEPELEETMARGKVTDRTTPKGRYRRNASRAGNRITGTDSEEHDANPGSTNESINKKMEAILKENAALKKLIPQIQEQLKMASVVNTSLGNIVKLVNEHTTTQDEKKQLVERFNKCKTSEDSNKLYEQIRIEYANANKSNANNFTSVLNSQIKEAVENPVKQSLNETTVKGQVNVDEGLYASWSFMERLNKIK